MQVGDENPWPRRLRAIVVGVAAIALVAALAWTLGGSESPTFDSPLAARVRGPIATTSAPARSIGEPIKELSAPGALDSRNELDDIDRILILGAGPFPIAVGRSDSPKVLGLLPDEKTTLVIRRDASGAVVLATAP